MSTNLNKSQKHLYFMNLALEQASKMLGNTKENPSVGCVLVKNDTVIGAGSTGINGRPHAEQNAISFSKTSVKNSSLYVTLEPCTHYGKTPPCVKTIINKKIKKVFFSIRDPDKRTFNKSKKILNKQGIYVNVGLMNNKIRTFYRSYTKSRQKLLPFVTCKLAVSKDFYTINKRKNQWITNELSRGRVHLMRSKHDSIMTSSNTIIKDNTKLSCRVNGLESRSPSKIILDSKLRIKINSRIVKDAGTCKTIILYNKNNKNKIKRFKKFGVKLYKSPLDKIGNLDLFQCLKKVKKLGYERIFLESGLKLTKSFLNNDLVDDFELFISNNNLKKNGKSNIKNYLKKYFKNKKTMINKVNLNGDKLITYKLN